jgi:site-specific DNA-methyltransferase (adenine-specific)
MIEYILIFRKPGERKIYEGRTDEEKQTNRNEPDAVFTRDIANNIWHIAPVPPKQLDHPCPFPEEIPYRLLNWYCYRGDVVLDPFCGIGTTLKVAEQTARHWVGYEILPDYIKIARKRILEPLRLRKQLIARFERVEYGQRLEPANPTRPPFPRQRRGRNPDGSDGF